MELRVIEALPKDTLEKLSRDLKTIFLITLYEKEFG